MLIKRLLYVILSAVIIFSLSGCIINPAEEKVGIRGEISKIILGNDSVITGILVEGKIEKDTSNDKAKVDIVKETKLYKGDTNEQAAVNDLKEGARVEVVFSGPVRESYPVQGTAKTIRIFESGDSGSEPPQNTEEKVSDYFPFKKDTHMLFKGTGNEYAEYEIYVDLIRDDTLQMRKINPGTTSVIVYKLEDGQLKRVFSRGEAYYRYDYTQSRNDEEIIIKEPIKTGTSWTLKDGTLRSITAVGKEISTPAGKFNALEITSKGPESTIVDYYVKDMGHVKSVFSTGSDSGTVTSELEKVESGVPFKQSVRFYFPEFSKDRIVYIDRDVEIYTNQDMKFKFQKELKVIPENSELSKVLTKNTQVIGITVDDAKDIVTVDLSSDFIKEMNAGTSLESMLLKSITNTFGGYYQKDKVIITINGKPYSSGHILMKPGEYFKVDPGSTVEFKK